MVNIFSRVKWECIYQPEYWFLFILAFTFLNNSLCHLCICTFQIWWFAMGKFIVLVLKCKLPFLIPLISYGREKFHVPYIKPGNSVYKNDCAQAVKLWQNKRFPLAFPSVCLKERAWVSVSPFVAVAGLPHLQRCFGVHTLDLQRCWWLSLLSWGMDKDGVSTCPKFHL